MTTIYFKNQALDLEPYRQLWAEVAISHDWYSEPFYIQAWVTPEGKVIDTVSFTGLDSDMVIVIEEDSEDLEDLDE